jgi:hypothetical protein
MAPGEDGEIHGYSPHHLMRSLYTKVRMHPALSGVFIAGVGLAAARLIGRK